MYCLARVCQPRGLKDGYNDERFHCFTLSVSQAGSQREVTLWSVWCGWRMVMIFSSDVVA